MNTPVAAPETCAYLVFVAGLIVEFLLKMFFVVFGQVGHRPLDARLHAPSSPARLRGPELPIRFLPSDLLRLQKQLGVSSPRLHRTVQAVRGSECCLPCVRWPEGIGC